MKHSTLLNVLCAALFLVMIGLAPESVFAQRGGHGGGGGFHGGGGGGFHGGGFHGGSAAYHGGGSSWHGGSGGWHGGGYYSGGHYHGGGYYGGHGGWGYPSYGYGYGWGLSIGFNWGPFWGGFGYPYGYAPGNYPYAYPYAYPYPYPYYVPAAPAGYAGSSSSNGNAYVSGESSDYVPDNSPVSNRVPVATIKLTCAANAPATNPVTIRNASYTSPTPGYAPHAVAATSSNYRPAGSASRQLPPLRPEVQNVIRALRAMPPAARQRQLDSGRYSNLTPKELEIVRYAADLPQS